MVTGNTAAMASVQTATMMRRARKTVRHPLRDDIGQQTATHLSALMAVSVKAPAKVLAEVTIKYTWKQPHSGH